MRELVRHPDNLTAEGASVVKSLAIAMRLSPEEALPEGEACVLSAGRIDALPPKARRLSNWIERRDTRPEWVPGTAARIGNLAAHGRL